VESNNRNRYTISPDAAYAAMPGGGVVLHLGQNRYFSLNDSAAVIWSMLEAGEPTEAIATTLVQQFEIDHAAAQQAIDALVGQLTDAGLLRPAD
jgi:Coenzyme PQQ synthesis protein D (PqqD)